MYPKYLVLFFIFFALSFSTKAQDFEVAPVVMQFKTNSGETETRVLTIKNHYSESQKYSLVLVDYELDENGQKNSVALGSTDRSLVDRVIISPSIIELLPNESKEVTVTMTIPKTDEKTRWGMIQIQVAKEKTSADADREMVTGVIVIPRIVVIITQSPASNKNYAAKVNSLVEMEVNEEGFRTFEVTIENTGDKVISGQLYLALANLETAEEEKFNSIESTIYPGAIKKVTLTLSKKLAKGKYALAALYDYGHYKAIEGTQILLEIK
jgi:uncharacterized cupredoxin-like copper-binding protein